MLYEDKKTRTIRIKETGGYFHIAFDAVNACSQYCYFYEEYDHGFCHDYFNRMRRNKSEYDNQHYIWKGEKLL